MSSRTLDEQVVEAEKVVSLTVYGGLEGVLKNLVPGLTKAAAQ